MSTDSLSYVGPRMNHVFVDGENVHQMDPAVIGSKVVNLTLLLGAKQTKLDAVVFEKLMAQTASVQLIRLASTGKNALDLTLSYYLGRAVLADPTGYFHVVSRDKGFDPLVEHLRSRHIQAHRHDDFATLTFSGPKKTPSKPMLSPVAAPLPAASQSRKNAPNSQKSTKS
jgi:hypothetical protein